MKLIYLNILLIALLLPGSTLAQVPGDGASRPFGEALTYAAAENLPLVIYVEAPWCGPCRQMERETFAHPAVQHRLSRVEWTTLTIDNTDRQHRVGSYKHSEAAWASHLGIVSTPGLVFMQPDGSVMSRHTGYLPPEELLPYLDAVLNTVLASVPD